ncbi:SRPBCC family protein [Nocardioides alkalitolerans]|uniref:SRPBCC family protein n=1 Tax=Nocardioides alkalitolerans TaxID=281714 RepID=UPI00041D8746|nr:SRPBCC family protein [Nocardioides alkalitolerans]
MSHNSRVISASPAQVWDVLADGWLYPLWVVGASRLRDVEPAWPAEGSRLHHSVGAWPLLIDDDTQVMASVPLERLVLRARGWPAGEASVTITLEPDDAGTRVDIREDAVAGPGRLVPKPLRAVAIGWRNVETLRRLAYVVEGRA